MSLDVLGLMDKIVGELLLLVGGLALALFAGWRIPAVVRDELLVGREPFWHGRCRASSS